jgi:hypothetical protein
MMAKSKVNNFDCGTKCLIVCALLVIACIFYPLIHGLYKKNMDIENYTSYNLPYGTLNAYLSDGNPLSYDGKIISGSHDDVSSFTPQKKLENDQFQRDVYQGHQLPIAADYRLTQRTDMTAPYQTTGSPPQKIPSYFDGKTCKPECCVGKLPNSESCSHGCLCDT